MGIVEVSKGRATVSSELGGVQVVIPAKKNIFIILFLFAWLGGWFFGEASAIRSFAEPKGQELGFTAFWLLGWTVGGAFAALTWLWNIAGREILRFGSGKFTYRRAIGPLGLTKTYDLTHMKDLRAVPAPSVFQSNRGLGVWGLTGGQIAFDYGASTVNVGAGVDEAEAKTIVQSVKSRYNV